MRFVTALVTALCSASSLVAQDTYTRITAAVELPNGSVAVLDDRDREVWLVRPGLTARERLVTSGMGPGEARIPMWLSPGPPGSVMLWDLALPRVTHCTPAARPACTTISMADDVMPGTRFLGGDREGHTFHVSAPRQGTPGIPDSSTVMRFDSGTRQFTPIGQIEWAPQFMVERVIERPGNIQTNRFNMSVPLVSGDQLAILPSGDLVAVPATGRELVRFTRGKPIRIALLPPRPEQAITPGERDSLLQIADSLKWGESMGKGMPASKRAFRPNTLSLSSQSNLWISYYEAGKATRMRYDGYALSGKRLGEVDVAINCRIVGVGRKAYYTACKDEDDLETLKSEPLPAWEK